MLIRPWLRKTIAWSSSKEVQLQELRPCGVTIEADADTEISEALESAFKFFQEHPDMNRSLSVGDFLTIVDDSTRFFQVAEFGYREHEQVDSCLVEIEQSGWLALLAEQSQENDSDCVFSCECA